MNTPESLKYTAMEDEERTSLVRNSGQGVLCFNSR